VGLLVISVNFLAVLVIISLTAWGIALWRGRRKRWVSASTFGALALVLSLATVADFINAHYAFLPRVADVLGLRTWPTASVVDVSGPAPAAARPHPHGAVVDIRLPGVQSGFGAPTAMVYFPPQYFTDPSRRFPVVYLLHGSPGAPIDWFRAARASDAGYAVARAGHPVILVAPRASRNWTDDSECVDRPKEHIATYVVKDVVREIDARFRTIPTRAARAVAGNSAGGYCALNLGLRNRALFSEVIDLSGFDHPTHDGGLKRLFGSRPDLAAVAAANTPVAYVPSLSPSPQVRVWLDCGRSDTTARRDSINIATELADRGFPVSLHLRPGGHDYGVWRPALAQGLSWAAASMSNTA
jgi:enterochelin esterase-like enzyme